MTSDPKTIYLLFACFMAALLSFQPGCNTEPTEPEIVAEQRSQRVVAASYALQYLTERLVDGAEPSIAVEFPAANSDSPGSWSPAVEDVLRLQAADLIVINGPGADYANWLTRVTIDDSKLCRSTEGFELKDYLNVKNHQVVHSHGPEGEHSHPYFVPYCWLDPDLTSKMAAEIFSALQQIYPNSAEKLVQNLDGLESELAEIKRSVADFKSDASVISISPSTKHLTRLLGVTDSNLLYFSSEDIDDTNAVREQIEQLHKELAPKILLTSYELPTSVKKIADELNLKIVRVELLDSEPAIGFLGAMKRNIAVLRDALAEH